LRAGGIAFEALKICGVAYLLVLAWITWRDKHTLTLDGDPSRVSAMRTIGNAILANLLNPKLTLFFFAFLPQFVDPAGSRALVQMLTLSGVFMAMTFIVFVGYGVFASAMRRHLVDRPAVVRRVRRAFSLTFVALGARLATTSR
jgi:threonine/homoserine/homoserine lactone efflux protein